MNVPAVGGELGQVGGWLVAVLSGPGSSLYGVFDLQEGDRDPGADLVARYGGRDRPELAGTTHVRDLHRDLRELGFLGAPDGASGFDRRTRWAVQEFQRYAKLSRVAAERLPDAAVTAAPISLEGRALRIDTAAGFPERTPFRVRVDAEIMEVTAVLGGTGLTVTRGAEDTAAVAHPAGSRVTLLRWSDRLVPVAARFYERYPGRVTGVVNAWTRLVLQWWKRRRRRCPVVVEAWDMWQGRPDRIHTVPAAEGRPARRADNVWGHDEVRAATPCFLVRDLSRAWRRPARPPAVPAHPELDVLGDWHSFAGWDGPRALPEAGHTWRPEGELLPEHLLPREGRSDGATLRELAGAADSAARRGLSTYKVVRAVGEIETAGCFDGLNGYDAGFISLGPCRWNAGRAIQPNELPVPPRDTWAVAEGELWAYLSYLKAVDRRAFVQVAGRFGLDVATDWGADGRALFAPGSRTYATRPAMPREGGPPRPLPAVAAEYDVFRGWHWFYRFQMAARTVDGFRRGMWHMARLRIRDILETPWNGPAEPATWTITDPQAPGGTRRPRVKDVFTSERATALVYHWHILRPADVVTGGPAAGAPAVLGTGRAGGALLAGYANAVASGDAPFAGTPDTWGDAEEEALIAHLRDHARRRFGPAHRLVTTLRAVHDRPGRAPGPRGSAPPAEILADAPDGEDRELGLARRSFEFDDTGLPPSLP